MNYKLHLPAFLILLLILSSCIESYSPWRVREITDFTRGWKFYLGDVKAADARNFNDSLWRKLDLPHDWSIEGKFSKDNPATEGGGALPGGIGWYRKSFRIPAKDSAQLIYIDFDGVYHHSEVWINGHYLGKRPNGYISFQYELSPWIDYGGTNVLAVKVDNSDQPNSRWYSGSGIYRNVWLETVSPVHLTHWGTKIVTPVANDSVAVVEVENMIENSTDSLQNVQLRTCLYDPQGKKVGETKDQKQLESLKKIQFSQKIKLDQPKLWSVDSPQLYRLVTEVVIDGEVVDDREIPVGLRSFYFDEAKGFFLNGKSMKINGVCMHHDLGCLGAALSVSALRRQLRILKEMGVNGIRTSHNPPAPKLLDLCDQMGFIVMDEAFDQWAQSKTKYDYALNWKKWHRRDLTDQILRDRNHPSVMVWSIGNEVKEQWDSTGTEIARELAAIVRQYDSSRPITAALNEPYRSNPVIRSGALDLIGFNYHHQLFQSFRDSFPGQKFIGTETVSALETRGSYDMPSDSNRIWPKRWDLPEKGNPDYSCSSYDNCFTPWGSSHEETLKLIMSEDYLSGQYVWTGFDYLGEPTPYRWPARSSYFGIVDLAGFPKDAYYLYQSVWTKKPVLHLFPHWNWKEGQAVDVWAYTNCDEVELFLNGQSQGVKRLENGQLHLSWRLAYKPGVLLAKGKKDGEVLTSEIHTAGVPNQLKLTADRTKMLADGKDQLFISVNVLDSLNVPVPYADNRIQFSVKGAGFIKAVDNGSPISHEPFQADYRHAFHGKCLVVIQSKGELGSVVLTARSKGLASAQIEFEAKE